MNGLNLAVQLVSDVFKERYCGWFECQKWNVESECVRQKDAVDEPEPALFFSNHTNVNKQPPKQKNTGKDLLLQRHISHDAPFKIACEPSNVGLF